MPRAQGNTPSVSAEAVVVAVLPTALAFTAAAGVVASGAAIAVPVMVPGWMGTPVAISVSTTLGRYTLRTFAFATVPGLSVPPSAAEPAGAAEKVAMTAPVIQRGTGEGGYSVAFVLPASMTAETAPEPTDPKVTIRTVPSSLEAVARYSGRWSQASYERHCGSLLEAIETEGFTVVGTPRFARFDPLFKPSLLRRNEVVVDVDESGVSPA